MATPDGPGPDHLSHYDALIRAPERFHLFHALRVLEARFADAPPLGMSRRPREDRVRLGQEAELAFPPTTIRAFAPPVDGRPAVLTNRFFGMFGQHGPLPQHLTEYARDRERNHGDGTFVAFANMFTHRLMSLLYRAWVTGQPAPAHDRGPGGGMDRRVAALSGLLGTAMRGRDSMPDLAKRHFAGHLAQGAKSAEALVAILQAFFRTPVTVQQFVGSWLDLEPGDRWQLGARAGLGQATSIGTRVWTRGAKFRVRLGPMGLADYTRLLPGGASMTRLRDIVRNHVGDALDWDVNLVLRGTEVPRAVLGRDTRLGQTSWIGTRRTDADAADLFVAPQIITQPTAGTA